MLINVYWNGKTGDVLVPCEVKTEAGFWVDAEPVQLAKIADLGSLTRAIEASFLNSGRTVPTPPRESKPVLVSYANCKTWSAFAKRFKQLSIVRSNEDTFTVEQYMPAPTGSGKVVDVGARKTMPLNTSLNKVAAEVDRIMRSE